jgi:carbonic anhydrase/acetyltransferase-like protein (isoleucine patch superfamily)
MESVKRRLNTKPVVGERVFTAESADILGEVQLGNDVSIWFNVVLRGDVEKITIGDCSNVQDGTVIHTTLDKYPAVLGNYVSIGHNVTLHGCKINDNVLVGIGAIVLDDAEIGENSIVAAGTLVPPGKKFPPNSLLMGSPAKVVKTLTEKDIEGVRANAERYLRYKEIYMEEGYKSI